MRISFYQGRNLLGVTSSNIVTFIPPRLEEENIELHLTPGSYITIIPSFMNSDGPHIYISIVGEDRYRANLHFENRKEETTFFKEISSFLGEIMYSSHIRDILINLFDRIEEEDFKYVCPRSIVSEKFKIKINYESINAIGYIIMRKNDEIRNTFYLYENEGVDEEEVIECVRLAIDEN